MFFPIMILVQDYEDLVAGVLSTLFFVHIDGERMCEPFLLIFYDLTPPLSVLYTRTSKYKRVPYTECSLCFHFNL